LRTYNGVDDKRCSRKTIRRHVKQSILRDPEEGWDKHRPHGSFRSITGAITIGYAIEPSEHGKGYGTEALQLMVDYLFLAKEIHRVQANTDPENKASQRILEKVDFEKEGISRKGNFVRGEWRDEYHYAILREEWKEPKILTTTSSK